MILIKLFFTLPVASRWVIIDAGLPRDSRGSLEVFDPAAAAASFLRSPTKPTTTVKDEDAMGRATQHATEWGLVLHIDEHTSHPRASPPDPSVPHAAAAAPSRSRPPAKLARGFPGCPRSSAPRCRCSSRRLLCQTLPA
jgi:hypothetical protein